MRGLIALLLTGCLWIACARNDGSTTDVLLNRAITLGSNTTGQAGVVYWGNDVWVTDDMSRRLIFDREARTVTFIDKRTQTYMVRTFDEVARKRDSQQKYRAANTSKSEAAASSPLLLTKTGKTATIAGYPAQEYTFSTSAVRGVVWVSDALRPPASWRPWQGLIAYLDGGFAGGEDVTAALATLDGYPLRTALSFGDGPDAWTITTEVADVVRQTTPGELATVPDDFRRENELPG